MAAIYGLTQFEFDPEADLKNYTVLLCDLVHDKPPWKPLFTWSWCAHAYRSIRVACEALSMPTTKGWEGRIIDGYVYFTVIETTEDEKREREPLFKEKIKPYIDDFDGQWRRFKAELSEHYERLKAMDIEKASDFDLMLHFEDFLAVNRRHWEIHFYCMSSAFYLYNLFEQICKDLLGFGGEDKRFQKLIGGFDSMLFKSNKEIWSLGRKAVQWGLGSLFEGVKDGEQLLAELAKTESGRRWVEEYKKYLEVYGWRCERMFEWGSPSWIEKPSLGLPAIKVSMKSDYNVDRQREELAREREEAEKMILSKVPVDEKEWFFKLLKVAQTASFWSEDHTYYLDMYCNALGRRVTREFGRRFARAGVIDEPDDVYFLLPQEILKAAISMEKVNLRKYVERRRKEWEGYLKVEPKPFYGQIERFGEVAMRDPVILVNAAVPVLKEELKADLYGASSAPGVAEGPARVIFTENELVNLQPGEILVAPATSGPWTVAFNVVKGVITDSGGSLSHAVIVAREYGIPCVAGTGEGTRKIKTGQKVKVDGTRGVVYFLS